MKARLIIAFALAFVAIVASSTALTLLRLNPERPRPAPIKKVTRSASPAPEIEQRDVVEAPPRVVELEKPKTPRRRSPPAAQPDVAPPIVKEPSFDEYAREVQQRARELREQHPDQSAKIDQLIVDAVLWSRASDREKARAMLDQISRELDTIH